MGRFFEGESPEFMLVHGMLKFNLRRCHWLKNMAIDRAAVIHGLPEEFVRFRDKDPWKRVKRIGRECKKAGVDLSLNQKTIIGNAITEGDKSQFWQKVLPVLFELVCLERWLCAEEVGGYGHDAKVDGRKVDWKCKHRNVPPFSSIDKRTECIATVPMSQREQDTEFYVFGQIATGMNEGFILGVMSKEDFRKIVDKDKKTKETGEVDGNGERYVDPVDFVYVDEVFGWHENTVDGFWPLRYMLSGVGS